jgi:hypothetical protein
MGFSFPATVTPALLLTNSARRPASNPPHVKVPLLPFASGVSAHRSALPFLRLQGLFKVLFHLRLSIRTNWVAILRASDLIWRARRHGRSPEARSANGRACCGSACAKRRLRGCELRCLARQITDWACHCYTRSRVDSGQHNSFDRYSRI